MTFTVQKFEKRLLLGLQRLTGRRIFPEYRSLKEDMPTWWEAVDFGNTVNIIGEPLGVLELQRDQQESALIVGTLGLAVLEGSTPRAIRYDHLNSFKLPGKHVSPNVIPVLQYIDDDGRPFPLSFRSVGSAYTFVQFVGRARWVLDWQQRQQSENGTP